MPRFRSHLRGEVYIDQRTERVLCRHRRHGHLRQLRRLPRVGTVQQQHVSRHSTAVLDRSTVPSVCHHLAYQGLQRHRDSSHRHPASRQWEYRAADWDICVPIHEQPSGESLRSVECAMPDVHIR